MKKILIVDDSAIIRQQASYILNRDDYEVIEAKDGQEGLDAIAKNTDLSFILLDLEMPIMNGLDMLQKVREKESLKHIPVFILTTNSDPDKISEAKSKGASGWMVKPFEPKALVKIISNFTSKTPSE